MFYRLEVYRIPETNSKFAVENSLEDEDFRFGARS